MKSHSLAPSGQKDVVIEPRAGGRWYEIGNDGAEQDWGKVVAYEAPERLLLIWPLNGEWPTIPISKRRSRSASPPTATTRSSTSSIATSSATARMPSRCAAKGMDGGWGELLAGYQAAAEAD